MPLGSEAGKQNGFATRSSNLKVSAFTRHETRNPDHTVLVLTDFATMAKLLLVSPIASVPCERAFSAQNLLKTRLRSLSEGVLESLMRIRLEGPLLKDFDVKRAAMHFCAAKQIRK